MCFEDVLNEEWLLCAVPPSVHSAPRLSYGSSGSLLTSGRQKKPVAVIWYHHRNGWKTGVDRKHKPLSLPFSRFRFIVLNSQNTYGQCHPSSPWPPFDVVTTQVVLSVELCVCLSVSS
jgi:hypothetical protein